MIDKSSIITDLVGGSPSIVIYQSHRYLSEPAIKLPVFIYLQSQPKICRDDIWSLATLSPYDFIISSVRGKNMCSVFVLFKYIKFLGGETRGETIS